MFLTNCFKISEGVFKREFRKQLFASLSVIIITLSHGISLGWLSPMLLKLQSTETSPLDFIITVEQTSWIGALLSAGGLTGNMIFGLFLDKIGRKSAIYLMAFPHAGLWIMYYVADSVEYLYAARFCGGLTAGAVYIVIPIFISEIADTSIRGRLTSMFSLILNTGILLGFIMASHLPYHLIPCLVIVLSVLYCFLALFYPETPQHLLRRGCIKEAERSLKFYKNFKGKSKEETQSFQCCFTELKKAVPSQMDHSDTVTLADFLNKNALKALCTGVVLMVVNIFCGAFAIINYMSNIFALTKSELHPDTNTIIIGMVQIVGTYVAIMLVDRFGRKILMIVSTSGMGVGLACLGMYAFFAEETNVDLSMYNYWLPVLLMAFTIFVANIGITSVTYVIIIEIMPPKIRSHAATICLGLLSLISFVMLKVFPILMKTVGLSATMWFCASVCAFGLFYISIFLEETKAKSINQINK